MPKITFIVSAFNRPSALNLMLLSLQQQTETNWAAIVANNAIYSTPNQVVTQKMGDFRITHRHTAAEHCYYAADMIWPEVNTEWLAFPSDDGYYVPGFAEKMLKAGETGKGAVSCDGLELKPPLDMVCCDFIWGRDGKWTYCDAGPQMCHIDKTTFIIRKSAMIPFPEKEVPHAVSDGRLAEQMVRMKRKIGRVPEVLVCHNP